MHLLYKICKTISKRIPAKYYHDMVVRDHEQALLNKNFDVFLGDNFDDPTLDPGMLPVLKKEFHKLDDTQREFVWQNLVHLLYLCKRCFPN